MKSFSKLCPLASYQQESGIWEGMTENWFLPMPFWPSLQEMVIYFFWVFKVSFDGASYRVIGFARLLSGEPEISGEMISESLTFAGS